MADTATSSDEEVALAVIALRLIHRRQRRDRDRQRRWWVQPWLDRRQAHGAFHALSKELRQENIHQYRNFLRMEPQHFEFLKEQVSARLPDRQDTIMRKCLSKAERLEVTLRFLASGDSYTSLSYLYRISRQSLGRIVPETSAAIHEALKDYMKVPTSQPEWAEIARDFEKKWHFPNCVGAMDGKHIAIKAPNNSGSYFFNYKHFHSIILLAVVDAHYRFIMYDLGVNGRNSDAGVFSTSPIAAMLQENTHNIPPPQCPTNWHTPLPHVVVGDEAFPLKTYLLKPYPKRNLSQEERVFNYRLSRARRVSENAFGILVNRFAVLAKPMLVSPEVATVVTQACIALHNYLRTERDVQYSEAVNTVQHPEWHREFGLQNVNRSATAAQTVRDEFRDYFNADGAVPWQWDKC